MHTLNNQQLIITIYHIERESNPMWQWQTIKLVKAQNIRMLRYEALELAKSRIQSVQ